MDWRRFFLELSAIIAAAIVCALIANGFASRDRKLALAGDYSNATTVPPATREELRPRTTETSSTRDKAASAPLTTRPLAVSESSPPAKTATAPPPDRATPAVKPPVKETVTTSRADTSPPPAKSAEPGEMLARFPPHDKQPYVELHGDDIDWLYKRGVLVLDARRTSVYEEGHIAGARLFSVWEEDVGDKIKALLAENRDQKQPIIIYCSGGDCEDSHMLAEKLWGVFFNNVYVYRDGFPDWQKRGGPIHKGPKP
jgi:rhodanese-related sulfurtransferase